jgi:hypothetical protein
LPVRFDGSVVDVLEMPTVTQDLNVFAPEPLLEPLLDAAERHGGVMHLLYHPAHVLKEPVASAITRSIKKAKERGMEWWTARQINDWQRARRAIEWSEYRSDAKSVGVRVRAGAALPQASILWLTKKPKGQTVRRWGFIFQSVPADLQSDSQRNIELTK